MQINKLICLVILALVMFQGRLHAQEIVSCSGNYFSNDAGAFSGSLGEAVIGEISNGQYSVSQGFQQSPYNPINNSHSIINPRVIVWPNPASNYLTFILNTDDLSSTTYALFDMNGNPLLYGIAVGFRTQLNISMLPAGIYLFEIRQKNTINYSGRIIKS